MRTDNNGLFECPSRVPATTILLLRNFNWRPGILIGPSKKAQQSKLKMCRIQILGSRSSCENREFRLGLIHILGGLNSHVRIPSLQDPVN